jgi:prepilin-type N-terminal cleavage/methylation domain-containing protein
MRLNYTRGLTLLEILIVVSIITLLLAIMIPFLRGPLAKRQLVEANATLDGMAMAFEKLKQDYRCDGVFCKGENGEKLLEYYDNNQFVKELAPNLEPWKATYKPRLNTQKTHYMEFKQHSIKKDTIVDPWGNPYRYSVFVRVSQGWPYEVEALYSDGPDRMTRTDDDIVRILHEYPSAPSDADPSRPKFSAAELQRIWVGETVSGGL